MTSFGDKVSAEIPRLRRYARTLTRDTVNAEDLVQSALVRALSREHQFQPDTDLRAWLFTILHNTHVNNVRRAVREGTSVSVDSMELILPARDRADGSIENEEVELALSLLPIEQREVLILIGLEDLSYEHASAILGVPVGTVRSRLSRSRDLLKALMIGTTVGESGHNGATVRYLAKKLRNARRRHKYF